jgi:hypothetical protein
LKEPFVIPIVTEPEPVVSGPEAVGNDSSRLPRSPKPSAPAPEAGKAEGTIDDVERANPPKDADVATEAG